MKKIVRILTVLLFVGIGFLTLTQVLKAASVKLVASESFEVDSMAYAISCQMGEDASTEAGINYLSLEQGTYALVTEATDTAFANATKVEGTKMQLGNNFADFSDDDPVQDARYYTITDYNYEVYLTDLNPGTEYIYRVTDGSQKSDVFKFKTSTGNNDAFTFMFIADPQLYSETGANAYYYCVEEGVKMANKNGTPVDFLVGGGDMVESGGDGYFWNRLYSLDLIKLYCLYSLIASLRSFCIILIKI